LSFTVVVVRRVFCAGGSGPKCGLFRYSLRLEILGIRLRDGALSCRELQCFLFSAVLSVADILEILDRRAGELLYVRYRFQLS